MIQSLFSMDIYQLMFTSPSANNCFYYINKRKIPGELSRVNMISSHVKIKHLMTGPSGNSEFCFPETLNVSLCFASGNIEVEGKQNSLFPESQSLKCFIVIPPDSKIEKNGEKIICLMRAKAVLVVRTAVKPSFTTQTTP